MVDEWPPEKTKVTRINLAVQRHNRDELAELQAKYDITSAYTVDATRSGSGADDE